MRTHSCPTAVAAVAAALLLLAGCEPAGGDRTPGPGHRSASGAAGPAAKDGTDVSACRDGSCEIEVSGPVRFEVAAGLGIRRVSITEVTDDTVRVQATGEGDTLLTNTVGEGGRGALNGLRFTVESVRNGTAVLAFATGS